MGSTFGWDDGASHGGYGNPPLVASGAGLAVAALASTREALVFGPPPALARPAGWPGGRPGDALRGLSPEARQQVVLMDLLMGLHLQIAPMAVTLSHGRMQHQVSAAGIDLSVDLPQVEAKADLRAERAAEAWAQRQLGPQWWASLLPLSAQRTPYTLELMAAGAAFAWWVAQRIKAALNQPRPADLSPRIQPMLPSPGSASLPGGHAAQAALLSGLLLVLVNRPAGAGAPWAQTLKPMLDELASRIAENREVAGLQFASANAAGKALGDKLLAALLEAKAQAVDAQRPQDGHALAWLWQQAAAEWGAT
jgi:hypothetical protein